MAAEKPGIVQCQDDGYFPTQSGQDAQIEVIAVQIVGVDDVGSSGRQLL